MRSEKEAARRWWHSGRAKDAHAKTDIEIVAREYDVWTRRAGIIIGLAFGLIFFLGILGG